MITSFIGMASGRLPAQVSDAAEMVTSHGITRHTSILTNDSMAKRNTPSRDLDLTARYIVDQFKQLGLRPDNQYPAWLQRYPLPLEIDFARSAIIFAAGGRQATSNFATTAYLGPRVSAPSFTAGVFVIAGKHTVESLQSIDASGNVVLYIPPTNTMFRADRKLMSQLRSIRRSRGLVILEHGDSAAFDRRARLQRQSPTYRTHDPRDQEAYVYPPAAMRLADIFAADGMDLSQFFSATRPVARALPSMQLSLDLQFTRTNSDTVRAPNVIGILNGSDPRLKNEYVVISTRMDHIGHDNNTSGIAALLEVVKAFGHPHARPRRSLLFLATSGGAKELWGSRFFVSELTNNATWAFLRRPRLQVIANINLEITNGINSDSLVIDGLREVDLTIPPDWTAAAHPDLPLAIIDGGTVFSPRSAPFAFTSSRLAIPSLNFHTGRRDSSHASLKTITAVDTQRAAYIARLLFYVSQTIANADRRPLWSTEGRRHLAESK